ncbi:DUF1904 family protein [Clostridium tertium]
MDELQELIQCKRNYFSLSVDKSVYIKDGEILKGEPVVEVSWFYSGDNLF